MLAKMKQEKKRWEKSTEAEGRTNCHKAKVWRWKETHPMREGGIPGNLCGYGFAARANHWVALLLWQHLLLHNAFLIFNIYCSVDTTGEGRQWKVCVSYSRHKNLHHTVPCISRQKNSRHIVPCSSNELSTLGEKNVDVFQYLFLSVTVS